MRAIMAAALLIVPSVGLAKPAPAPHVPSANALGIFQGQSDVGAPKLAGGARLVDGSYLLRAGGYNIARNRDEFHYVWRKVNGDFTIEGELRFNGPGLTPHRKAGFMARTSLDEGAAHIDTSAHGEGPRSQVIRKTDGGTTDPGELEPREPALPAGSVSPPKATFIRLERHGNAFTSTLREPGKPDISRTVQLDFPPELYLGLFLSSHNPAVIETASFDRVRLKAR